MNEIDIDLFIKWLAVSNAIVNAGGYGSSAENFYLYHQNNGKFIWIPWDNNEILIGSPGIIGTNGLNGLSLSMNEVTSTWPLIRYIIDEPSFLQNYKLELKSFNNEIFTSSRMNGLIDQYYDLISQSVTGASGEQTGYSLLNNEFEFLNEKNNLKNHVIQRNNLIYNYVQ
jgi:spore coat protein CotH